MEIASLVTVLTARPRGGVAQANRRPPEQTGLTVTAVAADHALVLRHGERGQFTAPALTAVVRTRQCRTHCRASSGCGSRRTGSRLRTRSADIAQMKRLAPNFSAIGARTLRARLALATARGAGPGCATELSDGQSNAGEQCSHLCRRVGGADRAFTSAACISGWTTRCRASASRPSSNF